MNLQLRRPRGFSWVTFLVLVLIAGGIWWGLSYGSAFIDNIEIKSIVHEAANAAVREKRDPEIRLAITRGLAKYKDLAYQPEDLVIQRTPDGNNITIDLTYQRTVHPLLVGGERVLVFNRHIEQDISPVKW